MNRILITVQGCYNYLLPEGTDLGAVAAALITALPVKSHGYGADEKFIANDDQAIQIRRIKASQFVADDLESLRIELAEVKKESAQHSKNWLTQYQRAQELE